MVVILTIMSKKQHKKKEKHPAKTQEKPLESRSWHWMALLFSIVVFAVLLYLRMLPLIFGDIIDIASKTLIFRDPDTCYHIRRILFIAQHHMSLPYKDPLLAYPHGAVALWSPLFDWILALPSFLFSLGSPSDNLVIYTALIFNMICVLLKFFILGLLMYKVSKNLAITALSVLLIGTTGPQARNETFEILDHDSFLLFLFALALYAAYSLFIKEKHIHFIRDILCLSAIIALFFWVWPGSYIFISVIALATLLYIILSKKVWLLRTFALIYGIAAILVAPLAIINHSFNKDLFRFEYVSLLTVLCLGAVGIFYYSIALIIDLKNKHRIIEIMQLLICFIFMVMVAYYSFSPLREGFKYAAAQNKWLSVVQESEPLFYKYMGLTKAFTTAKAIQGFGYLLFLFPGIYFFILIKWIKMPTEIYSILITSGLIFGMLALFQMKYAFEFSIPFGMMCALFIQDAYSKITKKRSFLLVLLFCGILIILQSPTRAFFTRDTIYSFYPYYSGFKWLKSDAHYEKNEINSTPANMDQQMIPSGVMAPWGFGHHLHLYSQVPTVADNFGFIYLDINPWEGFFDMARFFLSSDEDQAIAILKKYQCSYVVIPRSSLFEHYPELIGKNDQDFIEYQTIIQNGKEVLSKKSKEPYLNSIAFRLSEANGSANWGQDENAMNYKPLKHFRLVYESPVINAGGKEFPAGNLKIYKYVKGAALNIPVEGNPSYKLEGLIETNNERYFFYRQYGYLNDKIIVPYPTEHVGNYAYAQYYKVYVNGRTYEFNDVKVSDL